MNDEARFVLSFQNLRDDLVEGDNLGLDAGSEQVERQVSGGQRAGDRDALSLDFILRERAGRDDHRAVSLADTASAGHQRIFVLYVGIGVEGNRADIVDAFLRLLIERLDVAKRVGETQARGADFVRGQGVEHERVVGVGAVGDRDFADVGASCFFSNRYGGHFVVDSCTPKKVCRPYGTSIYWLVCTRHFRARLSHAAAFAAGLTTT